MHTTKFVNRVAIALVLGWLIGVALSLSIAAVACIAIYRILHHLGVL
jgi:hypothetical protein